MSFLAALIENPLLFSALLAAVASSIVAGIVGSYVVVKRISFISGSIAHSVLGGIGISLWLARTRGITWISPMQGAIVAAVLSALVIGWMRLCYKQREDSVIAALWAVGMAIGVIFISQTPGYNVEMTNYLLGNILWVSNWDLYTLYALDIIVIFTAILMHKRFLAVCFDEEHAGLRGLAVSPLYFTLLILIALSVVLLLQVVGIILVMAMLVIPASIANLFTTRLSTMMLFAVAVSALISVTGMALSYHLDWPGGATIALLAGVCYLVSLVLKK